MEPIKLIGKVVKITQSKDSSDFMEGVIIKQELNGRTNFLKLNNPFQQLRYDTVVLDKDYVFHCFIEGCIYYQLDSSSCEVRQKINIMGFNRLGASYFD